MSERHYRAYAYEGETRGHWHTYSVCVSGATDEDHECACTVAAPTVERARENAEDLARRLNRQTPSEMVREFHERFDCPIADKPTEITSDRMALRLRLITEEYFELLDAVFGGPRAQTHVARERIADAILICKQLPDMVGIADALADLIYVIVGSAIELGIDLDTVLTEVHRSNLAKLGPDGKPVHMPGGKVGKPAGWQPPDIARVLREQGWEG